MELWECPECGIIQEVEFDRVLEEFVCSECGHAVTRVH